MEYGTGFSIRAGKNFREKNLKNFPENFQQKNFEKNFGLLFDERPMKIFC